MNREDGATIRIVRVVAAPPPRVFDAWLDPEAIRRWMCPGDIYESLAEIDARVGGCFRIVMRSPGSDDAHSGRYMEIDRPGRLSFTWRSRAMGDRETLVTIEFREHADGCELVLEHTMLPSETAQRHLIGWKAHVRELIAWLGVVLDRVRVIAFTDLERHTELMSRLGDARGRSVVRQHERLVRTALREHGGSELKAMGDGFMASFGSPADALRWATGIQHAALTPISGEVVRVRIGVNAGEPVVEESDLFGAAVIAAARITDKASGGEVLVSNVVRELVVGKEFEFVDRGAHELAGLPDATRLWELRWDRPEDGATSEQEHHS